MYVDEIRLLQGLPKLEEAPPMLVAPSSTANVEKSAPRRYHPSDDLLLRHIELRRVSEFTDNNIFAALQSVGGGDVDDIDTLNEVFTTASLQACDAARALSVSQESESETMTVRRARQVRHERWTELVDAMKARASRPSERTTEQRTRVKSANRLYQQANKVFLKCLGTQEASRLLNGHKRSPARFWAKMKKLASDPGMSDSSASSFLMDHQNDENQKFVTGDPAQLKENMRKDRQDTYAMKGESELGAVCVSVINRSLAELHTANKRIVNENPAMFGRVSAVAQSAADACAPMMESDERRGIWRARDVQEQIDDLESSAASGGSSKCRSVKNKYPEAAAQLQRPITMDELLIVCAKIRDVGPGTDGVAPIVLRLQQKGYTMDLVLRLFQQCMTTGCQPKAWRMHRNLFHYKGKNSDPYYLGNHRGLGIDQILLKVWSLLMMERLEAFLFTTNGLSGLQGGFQRQRGPIEQVFTLSETVRAATKRRTVYLLFLDIEKAYDSVIRPILWARCLDKGIDGPFLAALQATYFGAQACVDVGGTLLDPVPLEVGVLQGNPLSPALFNIYIDGAIQQLLERGARAKQPYGVPLPLYCEDGALPVFNSTQQATLGQSEHLPCLYFADDGCLIAFDLNVLQEMLNITVTELSALGLTVNVRKTKWMIVPPQWANTKMYEDQFKPTALKFVLRVGEQPVALVDEFDYLGVTIWWRWDWTRACSTAQNRARRAYFGALRGGWQHRAGSLNSQMAFAHAKIFCHFNYIAPLTGTGGARSSAPWLGNERIIDWVLHAVSGQLFANTDALRIEAGVWPWQRRCDMLLLRMWCKYLSMPRSCVFFRAMCLSMQSMTREQRDAPAGTPSSNRITSLHCQPWAQQLHAAAERFGLSRALVDQRQHGLVVVQAQGDDQWSAPTDGDDSSIGLRLVATAALLSGAPLVEGQNWWRLPAGATANGALTMWTEQLKLACHTELRRIGNLGRQLQVRQFLAQQVGKNTRLRFWASGTESSFEQPYWRLADVVLARRLLALRFDMCPTEDYLRFRAHQGLQALPDRNERACYLCGCIDGVPHIFWPDTLVHVLLRCTCPALVQLRVSVRRELQLLAAHPEAERLAGIAGVTSPRFDNDSALLTALQLCIGRAGPGPILQPEPIGSMASRVTRAVAVQRALARRNAPQLIRDIPVATATARWIRVLTDDWCNIYRDVRRRDNPSASPGCRLATLVARHAVAVFSVRRKLLRSSVEFATRVRDPKEPAARHDADGAPSLLTYLYLTLWPTSITEESTASALNLSSPEL